MIFKYSSDNTQTLVRVSGSEEQGIIGKWSSKHRTGDDQYFELTTNNNFYFTFPFITDTGLYFVDGNTVRFDYPPPQKGFENQWTVTEDILTLSSPDKEESEQIRYKRKK
ncbi:hypothetical protein K8T06_01475 [bacterium]|nr:hypothetical protein [bacterium]